MTRIVLAGASSHFEERVREALDGTVNGDLRRWNPELLSAEHVLAVKAIAGEGPDVVALGPELHMNVSLELAQAFDDNWPEIGVIIVAEASAELWKLALRAGVRDVIAPDAPVHEVRSAFERALETVDRRRSTFVGKPEPAGPSARVVTVLSPKGGAGRTFLATNLAVGLAEAAPRRVVIVDLDLQFGDVRNALLLSPQYTMIDATRRIGELDTTTLKVFLSHHPSNLYALCAPDDPAEGEQVPADHAAEVIRLLASEFSFVVIDTAAGLNEHALSALELSTDFLLIADMDVSSVRSLRKVVGALDQLGMTSQRRHFVVNRSDARVGLSVEDVASTVGLGIDVKIPDSRQVQLSYNQGTPVLLSKPRSPAGRKLSELVERFSQVPSARPADPMPWRSSP
ncbi:MAG: CpaE family protein [Acidimicrobiia bacterium]